MARKIFWRAPEETTITYVEISTAGNKFGAYVKATSVKSTNDGLTKRASNSWSTSHTDQTGQRTTWYKIRFYDGTNYSDYSEPITGEEQVNLCSIDEVKDVIDTIGKWTDDEIYDAIKDVEDFMYAEVGTPIVEAYSPIEYNDSVLQDTYYTGEENIYRVDRVFYGTTTKHEYFLDDGYKTNLRYGMVRLLPVASGGPTLDSTCEVEVRYVPKVYNRIAIYRTAKKLLEDVDIATQGKSSKELGIITQRLEALESKLSQRIGILFSSDYASYDPVYGVGRKKVDQDYDRNKYISSYGW